MRDGVKHSVFTGCYSNEVIKQIFSLHFPYAKRVVDQTYGKGVFWNKWEHPEVIGCDLAGKQGQDVQADSTRLPFRDKSFDVAVVDPPFIDVSKFSTISSFNNCYEVQRNGTGQKGITALYDAMIQESSRVADAVIVKCKDTISSRKYIPRLYYTYQSLERHNFTVIDCALIVPSMMAPDNWKNVEHFRRKESYFVIAVQDYKSWMRKRNQQKALDFSRVFAFYIDHYI